MAEKGLIFYGYAAVPSMTWSESFQKTISITVSCRFQSKLVVYSSLIPKPTPVHPEERTNRVVQQLRVNL